MWRKTECRRSSSRGDLLDGAERLAQRPEEPHDVDDRADHDDERADAPQPFLHDPQNAVIIEGIYVDGLVTDRPVSGALELFPDSGSDDAPAAT